MTPYHEIDLNQWNRRDHFNFFRQFDNPFFNVTANVDVTKLVNDSRKRNISFFLSALHYSLRAVHLVEPFKYRILDEKVVCYDQVHPSTTVMNDENLFKYTYLTYQEDKVAFIEQSKETCWSKLIDQGFSQTMA